MEGEKFSSAEFSAPAVISLVTRPPPLPLRQSLHGLSRRLNGGFLVSEPPPRWENRILLSATWVPIHPW